MSRNTWFEGCDAKGPTEPGWIHEGIDASENFDLSGPFAGQGNARPGYAKTSYPAPSPENKHIYHGFMDRMRYCTPGVPQQFFRNTPLSSRDGPIFAKLTTMQ